ncbi:MAG: carbamoyltransferase HypF [Gammaproteobacteria bacterium]|nr:carbamoyltransferase HypF [Gammaproteobacteria bacterium]
MKRVQITVQGQVQGVGFRPHIYQIATQLGLTGFVNNHESGVYIEIQGCLLDEFFKKLHVNLPALAEIEKLSKTTIPPEKDEKIFKIKESNVASGVAKIPPDTAICNTCLVELFDSQSRYYLYPFINCTQCGPRYSITHQLPYDRDKTSMNLFPMCDLCCKDYENPHDRHYHAQPIACENCGPQLSCSLNKIAEDISAGKIIAIKGLGGYQLICDGKNPDTIRRLRENKKRFSKPFALMALNIRSAKEIVKCSLDDEKLLANRERSIVILPKKYTLLSDEIAPNLNSFGIMLPYTPIHYLLFHQLLGTPSDSNWINKTCHFFLIVTSANMSECPLIIDDQEAKEKLSSIADVIVSYNREIIVRVDDSIILPISNKPAYIRRARSFAPRAIALPYDIPPTLALGGHLKNTVCVTRGREAFVSQHIGDLNNSETIRFYRESIRHLLKLINIKPECIAHDYHPDFYSTQFSAEFNCAVFPIQHHHAHLAACAAEYNVKNDAIGIALDGFGLGDNFENWGGELIHYKKSHYNRLGSLKPLMQPGGDRAVKEPWRMAASILFELKKSAEIKKRFSKYPHSRLITELLSKNIHSPLSSSCGRLFDAASALLGICEISSYEAEAAMTLESRVTKPSVLNSGWSIVSNQLNMLPLFEVLCELKPEEGANLFHGTLASAIVEWIANNAKEHNLNHVLLAGGCFSNKVLSESIIMQLEELQLTPLYPRQCPPNDGGLSLGQAWIAGNRMMENNICV